MLWQSHDRSPRGDLTMFWYLQSLSTAPDSLAGDRIGPTLHLRAASWLPPGPGLPPISLISSAITAGCAAWEQQLSLPVVLWLNAALLEGKTHQNEPERAGRIMHVLHGQRKGGEKRSLPFWCCKTYRGCFDVSEGADICPHRAE